MTKLSFQFIILASLTALLSPVCPAGEVDAITILKPSAEDGFTLPPAEAIRLCSKAIENGALADTKLAQIYARRGDAFVRQKNYQSALSDFETAVRLDRSEPMHEWNRCRALILLDQPAKARTSLQKLLEAHPRFARAHVTLAALARSDDPNKAIQLATQAIEIEPSDYGYYVRASAHFQAGNSRQCLLDIDRCLAESPLGYDFESLQLMRAYCLLRERSLEKALKTFLLVLELYPDARDAQLGLAEVHFARGDFDLSLLVTEKLMRKDPHDAAFMSAHIAAAVGVGDLARALDKANEMVRTHARNPESYARLGNVLFKMEKYKAAVAAYEKSLAIDERKHEALVGLSFLYSSCPDSSFRNGKKALELAQRANGGRATDHQTLSLIGLAHAECGRTKEAIEALAKCIELAANDKRVQSQYREQLARIRTMRPTE